MEQTGEYRIAAPRQKVWDALNDPDVLGACITGCQRVSREDDQHFNVEVKARVGPVSATFQAAIELKDLDPPNSYCIEGGVKGGAAGFAKGGAEVTLAELEAGAQTLLTYTVNANVGGKLAQVGSRLVDGAARKMADEFFAAFSRHVTEDLQPPAGAQAPEGVVPAADSAAEVASGQVADPPSAQSGNFESTGQWKIWTIAFVVLGLAFVLAVY